jgi:hypothetical protein
VATIASRRTVDYCVSSALAWGQIRGVARATARDVDRGSWTKESWKKEQTDLEKCFARVLHETPQSHDSQEGQLSCPRATPAVF